MSNLQADAAKVEAQAVSVLARNWYWVALGCAIAGLALGAWLGHVL